jgi:hypothetical protein
MSCRSSVVSAARFLLIAALSYVIGISVAAAVTSLAGGSTFLLIAYTLLAGAPFALATALIGLAIRKTVLEYLLVSMVAVPLLTGAVWFGLGLGLGELFDETRVGLYAVFCSTCCATIAYLWLRHEHHSSVAPRLSSMSALQDRSR